MMRRLLPLFCLLSVCAHAENLERPLADKLYNLIATTQLQNHPDERYNGLWLNQIHETGTSESFDETDLFTGLHTMLMLAEVNSLSPLAGFDELKKRFNAQLSRYRADSEGEPTLNFWPLRESGVHNFSMDPRVLEAVGIPDIPNDFDDSALGYLWEFREGAGSGAKLMSVLAEFHDAKSGGFYTWHYESGNRVDCVVNLNILQAIAVFENHTGALEEDLRTKKDASLKYIQALLDDHKVGTCDKYYSRASQFFVALARVYSHRRDYVPFVALALESLKQHAKAGLNSGNGTAIAEYVIALKYFNADGVDPSLETLTETLKVALKKYVNEHADVAFVGGDSVFVGRNKNQNWYSKVQSTATALLALTL